MMYLSLKKYCAERNEYFAGLELPKSQVRTIADSLQFVGNNNGQSKRKECSN